MDNHNDNHNHEHTHQHEHEHGAAEPGGLWAGMLAGFLIGGLAGAIAMLLLAPQSGKRTRARLRRQSYALREQTAETMENVEDAMGDARDKTHQMTRDARKQAVKLEKRGHALFDG
jgi:gas vesicle protein